MTTCRRSSLRTCSSLFADTRGSIATIAGLTMLPMMLAMGAAIDYSRASFVRSELQKASDAAALAAAQAQAHGETDTAKLQAIARKIFEANYSANRVAEAPQPEVRLVVDGGGTGVAISATSQVRTTLMRIAGVETFEVGTSASAKLDKKDFEVAMMFDVTGSMGAVPATGGQTKIASLKKAAGDFVDTLMPATNRFGGGKIRIATIPFSQGVNAGQYAGMVSAGKSTSCVVERDAAGATDDLAPGLAPLVRPTDMACPGNAIVPLSGSRSTILASINALQATGATAGHIGTAWAWYTLSPAWNSVWPTSAAAQRSDKVRKIAVLMTDGVYNTAYSRGVPSQNLAAMNRANSQAIALCQGMRNAGITVYTIGFDVTDPRVRSTLSACASSLPGGRTAYFDAADGASLKAAYDEIARQIRDNLRLSG